LKATAYGLLIGDEPYIHPTHGHHRQVKKGNPPANLQPLVSAPLTVPLAEGVSVLIGSTPDQHGVDDRERLELLYRQPSTPDQHDQPGVDDRSRGVPPKGDNTDQHCPRCNSAQTVQHSTTKAGTPRRRCKECGKTWTLSE